MSTEKLFRIAIALKGLDGALQLVGGLVLMIVPATVISGFAHAVVTRDLLGDPEGTLARHLELAAGHFAEGRTFAVVYLVAHGLIKLGLVWALAKKVMRAYPVAAVVLSAFVVYEIFRAIHTHSLALPFFAALDVLIVVLVLREYRQLKRDRVAVALSEPPSEIAVRTSSAAAPSGIPRMSSMAGPLSVLCTPSLVSRSPPVVTVAVPISCAPAVRTLVVTTCSIRGVTGWSWSRKYCASVWSFVTCRTV